MTLERFNGMNLGTRTLRPLFVFLVWVFCLSAAPVQADDAYILGSGDKLKIIVFGNEDMSGDVEVDSSGQISMPLIDKVTASGRTVASLQEEIFRRLSPDYIKNPRITIEILSYRPFYIFGEVQRPGSYAYVAGMTVVNAVAVAGGYTYRANKDVVAISRGAEGSRNTLEAGRSDPVLPGDVVEVKERFF